METNKVINADCLEFMATLPDKCVDLTVTSPPYDNLRTYRDNIDKSWGPHIWEKIIAELFRITKIGGVVVWIVNDATIDGCETGTSFKMALHAMDCGFSLHDTMIWDKATNPNPSSNRYIQVFEYMFIFSKGKPKTINLIKDKLNTTYGAKVHGMSRQKNGIMKPKSNIGKPVKKYGARNNIWSIPGIRSRKEVTGHPAQFPEKLASDHIITWSNPGDIVFDPFAGSFTTAVAAERLGRYWIGVELSKEYCAIAKQRIFNEGNGRLFDPYEMENK